MPSMTPTAEAPRGPKQDDLPATDAADIGPRSTEHSHFSFRGLLRSASGTAFMQAVSSGGGFLTALLLARFLGDDGYGLYAFSFAWAGLLSLVATLGIDRFLVRGVAVYDVDREWPLMKGLLQRSNQLVGLASLGIAAIGCAIALGFMSDSLRGPFCVAMLLVPLTALTLLRQGAMQAFHKVVLGQVPEYLVRPVLIVLGVCALEVVGGGALTATSALIVNVSAVAIAFVLGSVLLVRTLPAQLRAARPAFATREWIRASLPMMLIAGVWLLNLYIGTLVTGTLGSPTEAGVFNIVQTAAGVVVLFLVAANMPLAPVVAKLHAVGDRERLERTTERIARVALLVSAPVCAAFALFPEAFLNLFGPGFDSGATALRIVALGQLVNAAAGPSGNVLIMTGHELVAARSVGLGAAVNLVLALVLVPVAGVTGAAIAFSFSLVLWNVLLILVARRRLGVNVTAFRRLSVAGG